MQATFAAVVGISVCLWGSIVRGDEKQVPLSEVPKAVIDAVKHKFPHAQLKNATKEVERNKTSYEIGLESETKQITVSLSEKGKLEEIETRIAPGDLPKAVTAAVASKYPGSKIKGAEAIVEFEDGEEERSFEVAIRTAGGKSVEVKLSVRGKIKDDENDKENENEKEGKSTGRMIHVSVRPSNRRVRWASGCWSSRTTRRLPISWFGACRGGLHRRKRRRR